MKLSYIALALAAATALPTIAYARNDADPIRESFDRAFNLAPETTASRAINPVSESDPVLASFERGLYSEPSAPQTMSADTVPGLVEVINVVVLSREADPVNASFLRDLNRGVTVCEHLNSAQFGGALAC